jgi:hypothetical protein
MQTTKAFISGLMVTWLLAGCSLPVTPSTVLPGTPSQPAYQTVAVLLTETAEANQAPTLAATRSPGSQETPQPSASPRPSPEATHTLSEIQSVTSTPDVICDLAQAGVPIDVTIPDDTKVQPGQAFTKTWRLVNAGTCAWTKEYAVVWFSGDDLGARREESLRSVVSPGESVDLSIDMLAPSRGGVFQSNWKLRNPQGDLFGIGPGGGAPFWVRIEVVVLETTTPSPTATLAVTASPTAAVLNSGSVTLLAPQAVDLESAMTDTMDEDDLSLSVLSGILQLDPVNGAEMVLFGAALPLYGDCLAAETASEGIALGGSLEGSFLCVRTNLGLTAYVKLAQIDLAGNTIYLEFLTWAE